MNHTEIHMVRVEAEARNVTVPAEVLLHLRHAIRREAGALGAVHALHDAGFAAGEAFFEAFAREVGSDPASLPAARFWRELDRFFESWGWGKLAQERIHPAFGVLLAREWGESDPDSRESQPGCAFSAGVLAHMLGRVAAGPIAVLEVACRTRGDETCSFLIGSEGAIHEIYGHLLDGDALDSALVRV
jgi:predicted hydrocarbon binding protein